jgi:hypothetical protein
MKLFDLDSPLMQALNKVAVAECPDDDLLYSCCHCGSIADRTALHGAEDGQE